MAELVIGTYRVILDDADYRVFKDKKVIIRTGWNKTPYAYIAKTGIHRIIMNPDKGLIVDHKNHNTLDNRRVNLLICTRSQNMWNRKRTFGSSIYKGVYKIRTTHSKKIWKAQITINNIVNYIGVYETQEEAAEAYNKAAKNNFGEFACLNKIGEYRDTE